MNQKGHGHKKNWLIAGTILGAAGVAAGIAMAKSSNMNMRAIRSRAARTASKAGHNAGNFISSIGDSLADKIR